MDLDALLPSYERATGFGLTIEGAPEDDHPDFIARRSDGLVVGVELTAIRQSPEETFFREILVGSAEWDRDDALDEMWRLVEQKSGKIRNYRTRYNILVLQNVEANFVLLCDGAIEIPVEDFAPSGFQEIWLADYSELRAGRHQEIELLGLYPKEFRYVIERSDHDRKPYR